MKELDLVYVSCGDEVLVWTQMLVVRFSVVDNAVFVCASLYEKASMSRL